MAPSKIFQNLGKKKRVMNDRNFFPVDILDINIVENIEDKMRVPDDQRKTIPRLTKFERARILGVRAKQLSMNSPVLVDTENLTDHLKIAKKELDEGKMPLIIRRFLPNKTYEDWRIRELKK